MHLPQFSVNRPITILMSTIIVIMLGTISLFYLPVELMPNISFGEISILIRIRGGIPPQEVEERVTKLVEEAVSTVSHLENIVSISKEGESTIILSFEPGTDMNFAALEVREKFSKIKNKLPEEIERPIIANYKYSDYPIMIVAFISKIYSPEYLRRLVEEIFEEPIRRVNGVANVEIAGGRERKILVELDQNRMVAHNVSLDMVLTALGRNNLNLLTGEYRREEQKFLVRTIGEFASLEQIKNIGVRKGTEGSIIRLKDVATVKDSYLEPRGFARLNMRPVVSMVIQKESTANTITVCSGVLKQLERFKKQLPRGVEMVTTYNQAEHIRKSINRVNLALVQGGLLAILVLLLFLTRLRRFYIYLILAYMLAILYMPVKLLMFFGFLTVVFLILFRRLRFVLIISIAIPISVMIVFGIMHILNLLKPTGGVTLNIMTLAGLALGIGMLVDNAIVVLENIVTLRQKVKDPKISAISASQEMLVVIVAGTLTTLVVFLPIMFMQTEARLLYSSIGLTVTISLLASLVVALTVVPLLASRVGIVSSSPVWINRVYHFYRRLLIRALRRRYTFLAFVFGLLVICSFVFFTLDREFISSGQLSDFTIFIRMPSGTRLVQSNLATKKVEEVLKRVPEIKNYSSHVEPWISKIYVKLVSSEQRKRSVKQVIESIRYEVENIKLYFPQDEVTQQPFIYFEEPQEVGSREVILDIYGYDYKILRDLAIAIGSRMDTIKGLTDTKIRMREGRPELGLKIDRQLASYYGLTVNEIALAIHGQMRGLRATYYHTKGREVETIARLQEKYRATFEDLRRLMIPTEEGTDIQLGQVAKFKYSLGPSEIWRKNKIRMIQVSANIGTLSLGKAVARIKKAIADVEFPENYYYKVGGNYETFVRSQRSFIPSVLLMLALVYMVLASLYESYTQPFIIMVAVPLAVIGFTVALLVFHKPISMGVVVGIIMLGGIVVNNSIILVDRINRIRKSGTHPIRAVVLAGMNRLRPILMTTSTTVLGLLPMAVDRSESAGLWSPLAITVIGGLGLSAILIPFVIPCIYISWEDVRLRYVANKKTKPE